MPLVYNPVVRNGLFRVEYKNHKKLYEAIDLAEAKYCLIDEYQLFEGLSRDACEVVLKSITVITIRKTIRQSDKKKADRSQKKINVSAG